MTLLLLALLVALLGAVANLVRLMDDGFPFWFPEGGREAAKYIALLILLTAVGCVAGFAVVAISVRTSGRSGSLRVLVALIAPVTVTLALDGEPLEELRLVPVEGDPLLATVEPAAAGTLKLVRRWVYRLASIVGPLARLLYRQCCARREGAVVAWADYAISRLIGSPAIDLFELVRRSVGHTIDLDSARRNVRRVDGVEYAVAIAMKNGNVEGVRRLLLSRAASVVHTIDADIMSSWEWLCDLKALGRCSSEVRRVAFRRGFTSLQRNAQFIGWSTRGLDVFRSINVVTTVVAPTEERPVGTLAFVTLYRDEAHALWRFILVPSEDTGSTTIVESYQPSFQWDDADRVPRAARRIDRAREIRGLMVRTLFELDRRVSTSTRSRRLRHVIVRLRRGHSRDMHG